jgi:hypothetical protein
LVGRSEPMSFSVVVPWNVCFIEPMSQRRK